MRHRRLFRFSAIAIALLAALSTLLLLSIPVEARKKTAEKLKLLNLKAHPTRLQKLKFALMRCKSESPKYEKMLQALPLTAKSVSFEDYCAEQKPYEFNTEVVESTLDSTSDNSFRVIAEILTHEGSRNLDVMLAIRNDEDSPPIELLPQKVFLVDNHGQVYAPVTEYAARATVAAEHHLPQFAPPPPETYYTITQEPRDSRVPILPADPSQPQFTIYETQVTPHFNYSRQLGYELGYLISAWRNKSATRRELRWIDENWFHQRRLGPGELQSGYLMFENALGLLPAGAPPFIDASGNVVGQPAAT